MTGIGVSFVIDLLPMINWPHMLPPSGECHRWLPVPARLAQRAGAPTTAPAHKLQSAESTADIMQAKENLQSEKGVKASMKPSERINRFVNSRRLARMAKGDEAAYPDNVSGFIRDHEVAGYISKLLEVIDEQHERIAKLERQPALASYPRSALAKPPAREKRAG